MKTRTLLVTLAAGLAASASAQTLKVGDDAPKLSVEKFVAGQETATLEKGSAYVIGFWATSSAPSVQSLQRLGAAQEKHVAKGLRVIAVGASETGESTEQRLQTLASFVEERDIDLAVAYDDDQSMLEDWMRPAGRDAVPTAFVVDREGKIAFIGNPLAEQEAFDDAVEKAAAQAAPSESQSESKADRPYELMTGDKAPELAIGEWVKGEPVQGFKPGQVYVIEFWATWCGPCIAGMPHVSELQQKHGDDVVIIGVNAFEDPVVVEPFMKDRGEGPDGKKLPSGDELMQYRVGIEKKDDPESPRNGVMAKTWMVAAGRNSIPSAFIVDQQGRIAWQGHPTLEGEMDRALEQIIAGEWDLEAEKQRAAEAAKEQAIVRGLQQEYTAAMQQQDIDAALSALDKLIEINPDFASRKYITLLQAGRTHEAYELAREIMPHVRDNPGALNQIAWSIVDPQRKPDDQDLDLALTAAERAAELTDHENPSILDTLACVYWDRGEKEKAVETQEKAVKLAAGTPMQAQLQERLETFKKDLGRN